MIVNAIERLERRGYFAAPSFTAATDFAAGAESQGIATADFNRDGKADLAVTNYSAGTISILIGDGLGAFAAPVPYTATTSLSGVAVGDLNGDGFVDMVGTGDDIVVVMGNGDGTFDTEVHVSAGNTPQNSAIGDLNNDQKQDVVTANVLDTSASVFKGNGDGALLPPTTPAVAAPADVVIGDVNNDQIPDLSFALFGDLNTGAGSGIAVLLGNGDATFQAAKIVSVNMRPSGIALGDLNEDGLPDLVTGNGGLANLGGNDNVAYLRNTGNGNFAAAVNIASGTLPNDVVIIDFNNDGHLDIASSGSTPSGGVAVHQGNGDGTFVSPQLITTPSGGGGIVLGDFNGDGRPDMITTTGASNSVSVMLNTSPFATLSGGTLTIDGTAGNDVFTLSIVATKLRVNRNGAIQNFTAASVTQINLTCGEGNDAVTLGAGVAQALVVGGGGNDVIVSNSTAKLSATGAGGNDIIVGGAGGDELSGATGKDRIFGGLGDDYLLGGASNDYLNGQDGNDTCSGAGGKDRLFGEGGADYLLGGASNDLLDGVFISNAVADGIDTLSGNAGTDTGVASEDDIVASIENLV